MQVVADILALDDRELESFRHGNRRLEVRERARAAAEQRRRQVDQEFVRESGRKQRAGKAGAAFDEQFVDLPRGEKLERSAEIDASGCRRDRRDLGTRGAQRFGARRNLVRADQERLARRRKDARRRRRPEPGVEHDAKRLAYRTREPDIEPGIVREHGAAAGHDGRRAGTQALHILARSLAGDPAAFSTRQCRAAVEARGELDDDPWPAASHARDEARIELARLALEQPAVHGDSGRGEPRDAAAVDARIGVAHRIDDARDTRRDERIGAGRRAPVMAAGLERDVGGRAARGCSRRAKRHRLRVREAGPLVPSFRNDAIAACDHAADTRVRVRRPKAAARELERPRHVPFVA